uniref:Uncharacterized protein n=1 Tax=Panagrellus redivivus TaxID=6233 RepID=A0A7E4ULJ9_PANRE
MPLAIWQFTFKKKYKFRRPETRFTEIGEWKLFLQEDGIDKSERRSSEPMTSTSGYQNTSSSYETISTTAYENTTNGETGSTTIWSTTDVTTFNFTDISDSDFIDNMTDISLLEKIEEEFETTTLIGLFEKPKGMFMRPDEIVIVVLIYLLAFLLMTWAGIKSYKIASNEKKLQKTIEAAKRKRQADPTSIHEANELTEDVMATGPMNDPLVDVGALPIPPLMKHKKKPKKPRRPRNMMSESSRPETSNAPKEPKEEKSPPKPQSCPTAATPSQPSQPSRPSRPSRPSGSAPSAPSAKTVAPTSDIFDPANEVSCIGEVDVEPKK